MKAADWIMLVANAAVVGIAWWDPSGAPELVTLALVANSLYIARLVQELADAKHDLEASLRIAREMMKRRMQDWGEP